MKKTRLISWIKWLLIIYGLAGIAIYYGQDYLLFHPKKLTADHIFHFNIPFRESRIPMNATDTINMVQFSPVKQPARGLVVYFHGNMRNVEHYAAYASVFTNNGYEVWMPDYPGFGKSTGLFEEKKIYRLADQVLKMAHSKYGKDSVILYGRSFGTGPASYAASTSAGRLLILESPYFNLPSLLNRFLFMFPLSRIIKYDMPVWSFLENTDCPVVIFHGRSDGVIPFSNAEMLKPFLKSGDEFIPVQNGSHNDLTDHDEYKNKINALLGNP
jgi:hypothetical protein